MRLKSLTMVLCDDSDCGAEPLTLTFAADTRLRQLRRACPGGVLRCVCGAARRVVVLPVPASSGGVR